MYKSIEFCDVYEYVRNSNYIIILQRSSLHIDDKYHLLPLIDEIKFKFLKWSVNKLPSDLLYMNTCNA